MRTRNSSPSTKKSALEGVARGLYLKERNGNKTWVFKYQMNGVRHELGLGNLKDVNTTKAKAMALKYRAMIADGVDPISTRVKAAPVVVKKMPTFKAYATKAIDRIAYLRQWQNDKHETQWYNTVKTYALPLLGEKRMDEITTGDIVAVLEPIWIEKTETANRLRERLNAIFAQAVAEELVKKNPVQWEGNLELFLPKASIVKRDKGDNHHAALTPEQLKELVAKLYEVNTVVARTVLFGIFTVGRASEFSQSKWGEFDLNEKVFKVPTERRKDKKPEPFIVPLSRQAMAIVEELPHLCEYPFSFNGRQAIAQDSMRVLLQRICNLPVTMHGMRSTFSDWCAQNNKNFLVSEKCLMHNVGGKVFMAYQRDTLVEQRRQLLQEWADFLCNN